MSNQTNEILTIAGKRVRVAYCKSGEDCCARCCFSFGGGETCVGLAESDEEWPCEKFDLATAYFIPAKESPATEEETHSLQEWAKIMAERPDLRAEFDKMCPPQPIQGSIAQEPAVNKHAVTHAFLHCDKAGKIVSEMYGDKFNNPCNRDKYLAFLGQVNLDDRFGELAGILQKYGAMPAPEEQPEADLEAEISRFEDELHGFEGSSRADCINIARHFAEWGAEHLKK